MMNQAALEYVTPSEVVALLDTQAVFDLLLKQPYPTTQAGVLERLQAEKLIRRSNGHYLITNLGALLFAKDLNAFEGLARKAARVIKYKGISKLHTEREQLSSAGYASGFSGMTGYISALLPSNEVIEQALRREVQMYPPIALRELMMNALIHQDFRERGTGVLIEIYDDRVEISNPGKPMIAPDRFIDEFQSRNELLASAMRRIGFCEEKGSGIDKVIVECEVWQLPAPDFQVKETHTKAILFAHKSLEAMSKADKIRACYQHCVLMYVTNRRMTNQSLRERFQLAGNHATATRIIRETIAAGQIKLEESGQSSRKFASYLPFWA
jgi:ATP-dependent DNA helicase RecG